MTPAADELVLRSASRENTTNAVKLYENAGMRAVRRTDEFERRP